MPSFNAFKQYLIEGYLFGVQQNDYKTLFKFGGFPDPLIKAEQKFYNIWQQERKALLIREDIRDATKIRELSLLEMLSNLIVERIVTFPPKSRPFTSSVNPAYSKHKED